MAIDYRTSDFQLAALALAKAPSRMFADGSPVFDGRPIRALEPLVCTLKKDRSMPKKLTDTEIARRLPDLVGWKMRKGKLHKKFQFEDFAEAFGFMAACAVVAQGMNHHPDWSNGYNVVDVELSTHDAGGITELDFKLAQRMDTLHSTRAG